MSINPGEFGISERDQFEIRFRAVRGAINDIVQSTKPNMTDAEHLDAAARIDQIVEEIMADSGVDEIEARLMVVEQFVLNKAEGEING